MRGNHPKKFNPANIDQYERVISFGCLVKEVFLKEVQEKMEDWIIDNPRGRSPEEVRKI